MDPFNIPQISNYATFSNSILLHQVLNFWVKKKLIPIIEKDPKPRIARLQYCKDLSMKFMIIKLCLEFLSCKNHLNRDSGNRGLAVWGHHLTLNLLIFFFFFFSKNNFSFIRLHIKEGLVPSLVLYSSVIHAIIIIEELVSSAHLLTFYWLIAWAQK